MFSGCPSVRPSVRCPLTPVSRDAISLYLVEGFQLNLAHYAGGIAEEVCFQDQRSMSNRIY